MSRRHVIAGVMFGLFAFFAASGSAQEKPEPERRGTVVGVATEKGGYWIDVKADGEEKARRYYCGSDQKALRAVKDTEVGSRIRLEWLHREVFRVVKIDVLKPPAKP